MTARLRAAAGRITCGTGLLLLGVGDWLGPATGRAFLAHLAGTLAGLVFAAQLLARAPHLIYAIPVAWLTTAWHMSDTSATPPPEEDPAPHDVYARETGRVARVEYGPNGVTCTLHPEMEEVTEP